MQSGYDINHLAHEALTRWLKPVEVFFILQNYEEHHLTHRVPQKPAAGSLYLFNKRVLKFFRKDGHSWRRRKDQRNVAEAHERLKVGDAEAINCYYAHGEENPNFQRRSYWILDPAYNHIVLVHYRDISKGQISTPSSTFSHPSGHISFANNQPESSFLVAESRELYHNKSSPSSVEITSSQSIPNHGVVRSDNNDRIAEVGSSPLPDLSQALQRLEHQLSLNDDEMSKFDILYDENDTSNDLENLLSDYEFSGQTTNDPENLFSRHSGGVSQLPGDEDDIWKEMLESSMNLPNSEFQEPCGRQEAPSLNLQEEDSLIYHAYSPVQHDFGTTPELFSSLLEQDGLGISLQNNTNLTISERQKFTIREISPEWCYTTEGAKIIIIGSFLCDPSECAWTCMIGDTEVPARIIQEGVLCCHAPPHLNGKVDIFITSGNRESCSEVREFEYRVKPNTNPPKTEANISSEELMLLVKFTHMLLSDSNMTQKDISESRSDLPGKTRISEESWSHIIDALLVGASTSFNTINWLLEELLKDKLGMWLSFKLQTNEGFSLTKKEQGVIHMAAGLGFEWALQPILNSGVSIDFRDINGWTALHWAARFGREEMVAALIASGASAGAVTDPTSQDSTGKTPASIAAICGHKGLAGYLSEVALTSHLSSLTLLETELSKESAALEALEAERRVNDSFSNMSSSTNADQDSLRDTLDAVRNASLAAARIQAAFRAHSFRKRQQKRERDYIHEISTASKLTFGKARDYNTAALAIQKNYRGWKGRRDFNSVCQKVIKIQAHVRGYLAKKKHVVCWAVGVLEKAILRWHRRGVGLRGFQLDLGSIDEDDEDILKVFRKLKVDAAIDEAVSRVLSMFESPTARQQYRRLLEKYRQAKLANM